MTNPDDALKDTQEEMIVVFSRIASNSNSLGHIDPYLWEFAFAALKRRDAAVRWAILNTIDRSPHVQPSRSPLHEAHAKAIDDARREYEEASR